MLLLCIPAFAEEPFRYVMDDAKLLTEKQQQTLEDNAKTLAEKYGFGVYIVTVQDITTWMDAPDMETAAEQLYLTREMGEGDAHNGILLLMSMEDRDWALFAFGYGNTAFTDYGKSYLSGEFLDDFGKDVWYNGFRDYQKVCGEMLDNSLAGEPVDVDNVPPPRNAWIYGTLACIVIGILIAVCVVIILKAQLKSVAHGTQAEAFVTKGGLHLTDQYDRYTNTTVSRVYDPPSKSSSSGSHHSSGGTSVRSSGGSSASGKF